ncbi:MAG: hypothetical protein WDN00_18645 [Limisphaerales bacterium]
MPADFGGEFGVAFISGGLCHGESLIEPKIKRKNGRAVLPRRPNYSQFRLSRRLTLRMGKAAALPYLEKGKFF